ncbi:helix-turn-helix domain-containing protein [Pseudodesulfovibrio piezophilus]|uniref:helix-turn-helix domain-containing protein n=1 Tax=Pseudodesulfovibrio piezophilus TaxID=879567 RepID=UPI0003489B32|nr:helix-turn-helix domain-containing protein [Pseudodesulfovibrio piezophilus]
MQHRIKLLTIQEAADILRVNRTTISRMISTGELPCVRVRSRKLIREQDLLTFIDSQIGIETGESSQEY